MFLKIERTDSALIERLARFISSKSISDLAPEDLAFIWILRNALDSRNSNPDDLKRIAVEAMEIAPVETLKSLKQWMMRSDHRILSGGNGAKFLVNTTSRKRTRSLQIVLLSSSHVKSTNGVDPEMADLAVSSDEAVWRLFEDAIADQGCEKIAANILNEKVLPEDLDGLVDLPVPQLVSIVYTLWRASNDGHISKSQFEIISARILRVSVTTIVKHTVVFSIPGIGPAASSLLFARRIERL